MAMIFDTHAHYDDHAFDEDREELLSGLFRKGVGLIMDASAAARSMPRILQLTRNYGFLYGSAGLHPCETYSCGDNMGRPVMDCGSILGQQVEDGGDVPGQQAKTPEEAPGIPGVSAKFRQAIALFGEDEIITADWRAGDREELLIRAMLTEPRIQAVGEIGLDYHYEDTRKEVQKDWFARQIAIAREFCKPIFIHSRDAAADTLDMVKSEHAADVGGIIHCFSYSKEMAAAYLDLGFLIGIGGVLTYKNAKKLKDVAAYVPLTSIVLETDCPYLAPAPFRGKRNDSSLLNYVAEALAQIKGVSVEEVITVTEANARRVYRIG
ncbi:MAG: TatD family hydrolase [Parasporobacterium sp.]|nr:TatD family hydrolase [Parasporobacterium sp.]